MPTNQKIFQLAFWILIMSCIRAYCQIDVEKALEVKIEELQETSSSEDDLSDLTDRIQELKDHPLNLNKATVNELRQLPFLTEKQINDLVSYKETYGELFSISELQAIDGFDSATIQNILPYFRISPSERKIPIRFKDLFSKGHIQFLGRYQQVLQKQQGYSVPDSIPGITPAAAYPGNQQKYYFRVKYDYFDRISIGITGEKDPGEGFFSASQPYGMDLYSGYMALKNTGILKNLIFGNFNADFGQGLTLCSRLSFGALPSSGNLRRFATGITPSLSANETSYLRGIAATIKMRNISASIFYSRHKRDATIASVDSLSGEISEFSSFEESGYHRLPDEISGRNAITETVSGGNINYRNNFFTIGLTGFHSSWSASYSPRTKPYNQFRLTGRSNLNAGMDFQFIFRSVYGFGEISRSMNGGFAWLAGIQVNPDPGIKFSLIFRDYHREFQDLLNNAIGQNDNNANETGLILNFAARITSRLGIYTYIDIYKFPWLKYRSDFISYGSEYSGQVDYTLASSILMLLRFRIKNGQVNANSGSPVKSWTNVKTASLRYQADWKINDMLNLSNRFEVVRSSGEGKNPVLGYLVSQDASYKPNKFPVRVSLRYAIFNTGSFEARIYTFENDVLYGYSVPVLDGSGIRCFLMLSARPWRFFELWARYSQTFYSDRQEIGTGPEKIEGNKRSEIKIQFLFRF